MNKKYSTFIALIFLLVGMIYMVSYLLTKHSEITVIDMNQDKDSFAIKNERDYIEYLIPSNSESIEVTRKLLEKESDLRPINELAEKILARQSLEIENIKKLYELIYEVPYEDTGVYSPMMRSLSELSGEELDRTYLEDMIEHHKDSSNLAEKASRLSLSQEITNLVKNLILSEESEVSQMELLLKLLPR